MRKLCGVAPRITQLLLFHLHVNNFPQAHVVRVTQMYTGPEHDILIVICTVGRRSIYILMPSWSGERRG